MSDRNLASILGRGFGGFLYYNANILNQYLTLDDYKALSAEYEKRYKQYEHMPALEVSNVFAEVDIYPNEQELRLVGYYDLINNQAGPISALHLSFSPVRRWRLLNWLVHS